MALQPNQVSETSPERRRSHLKEVTNDPPPDSLGALLRGARLKLGQDLKDVSKATKIKPEYLEALEEGRMDALPGRTYAIGFLRSYAVHLGLDAAACVARLKSEYPDVKPAEATMSLALPEIEEDVHVPQGVLIIGAVLLVALIYGGIYLFRAASDYMEERAHPTAPAPIEAVGPAPKSQLAPVAGEPSAQSAPQPASTETVSSVPSAPSVTASPEAAAPSTEAAATPSPKPPVPAPPKPAPTPAQASFQVIAPAGGEDAQDNPAELASPSAQGAAHSATSPAVTTAEDEAAAKANYERAIASAPRAFGSSNKTNRVMLRANAPVFVRVETEGPRNQVLFEGTLGKGELYFVPQSAGAVLVTRNGGALEVFVDGTNKGAAGPAGIALKGMALNPDSLKARP